MDDASSVVSGWLKNSSNYKESTSHSSQVEFRPSRLGLGAEHVPLSDVAKKLKHQVGAKRNRTEDAPAVAVEQDNDDSSRSAQISVRTADKLALMRQRTEPQSKKAKADVVKPPIKAPPPAASVNSDSTPKVVVREEKKAVSSEKPTQSQPAVAGDKQKDKKARKKVRSKQKNFRKDTRPDHLKPGGVEYKGSQAVKVPKTVSTNATGVAPSAEPSTSKSDAIRDHFLSLSGGAAAGQPLFVEDRQADSKLLPKSEPAKKQSEPAKKQPIVQPPPTNSKPAAQKPAVNAKNSQPAAKSSQAAVVSAPAPSKKSGDVVIQVISEHDIDDDVGEVDAAFVSNW